MTHFNHEWDTTKTPAVPVSVGDRYYAQDLNDDFNYLKHLPYEVFLQGRSRGVMIAPSDTWDNNANTLTLSGGFGVVLQDCVELDPDEDFVIPPKTHSSPRYERIPFADTVLAFPNNNTTYYIVATPTKRSLLQRTKALFAEQYASRVRYDGIITIQDTTPTAGQILVGLYNNREYCLLIDNDPTQCKDNIILKKWFGQYKITQGFVSALQTYYNTTTSSITTDIIIDTVTGGAGIGGGTFNNCTISIDTISNPYSFGIDTGTFNNCAISIGTVSGNGSFGINNGTFNNCDVSIGTMSSGDGGSFGIHGGTFNNCDVSIGTINSNGFGVYFYGTFNNCIFSIGTINSGGVGVNGNSSIFNNCIFSINTASSGGGIISGVFNNCVIPINTASSGVISNTPSVKLYLTRIECSAITDLSNTGGKLNVLNSTVLHTS